MKVGLIHALTASVAPIERAFQQSGHDVELLHFMDTGLLPLLQKEQSLTPAVIRRMSKLTDLATESNVDCIQLTCSAFNDVTAILQPLYPMKLFRSDEAMLDKALLFERIGFISTVNETPPVLLNYVKRKNPNISVATMVSTEAFQKLSQGNQKGHDEMIKDMIRKMESKVDVIVLTQYSQAHIVYQMKEVSVPILTGPEESVKRCLQYSLNGVTK